MANREYTANYSNGAGRMYLSLNVYTVETNINENYTVERADLWTVVTNSLSGWWNLTGNSTAQINTNGNVTTQNVTFDFRTTGTKLIIGTWDTRVYHEADGSKSINVSAYHNSGVGLGNASIGSQGYICDTIPRASTVTATNCDIGSATSINIARASSSFKHTLAWAYEGSTSYTNIATNVDTSYGWTVPTSVYAQIPNSRTKNITIRCTTYSGSTQIGSPSYYTFTASVNYDINIPTYTHTKKDTNSTTVALTGNNQKYIKGHSNLNVTVSATPKNSATISTVTIAVTGDTRNTTNTTFSSISEDTLKIAVVDSRNIGDLDLYTLDMINYFNLNYSSLILKRETSTSNTIKLNATINWWNASFGSVTNTLSLKYRKKLTSSSSYGSWTDITAQLVKSGNVAKINNYTISTTDDWQSSYDYEFEIKDKLVTLTPDIVLGKGEPIIEWSADDVNINGDLNLVGKLNNIAIMPSHNGTWDSWRALAGKDYFCSPNTITGGTGQPNGWGFVTINIAENDVNIIWYTQSYGEIYRYSGSTSDFASSNWKLVGGGDTGWILFDVIDDVENFSWEPLSYRRKNGIVYIHGGAKINNIPTGWWEWLHIATLPEGYRPKQLLEVACGINGYPAFAKMGVGGDGKIKISGTTTQSTSAEILFNCSFIADN